MIDILVLIAYAAGLLLCFAIAVDVITQHPYEWSRAGSSQKFRVGLIAAPLFAIFLMPLGLAPGLFYLWKVRPRLTQAAQVAASQGWPRAAKRPILGLKWVWRELQTRQKVKTVLAVGGSAILDTLLILAPVSPNGVPQWFSYALFPFLLPTFFAICYSVLSGVQRFLPVAFRDSGFHPARDRIQELADSEYQRRYTEFQQRDTPRPPWDQRRW